MDTKKKKSLLLVEDEAIIALAQKKALNSLGYAVQIAGSGEAAVALMQGETPVDLILMDIDLGTGMDGTETAEIILQSRNIPIVFLSSHTAPEVVEKTEKITSYGYVVKDSSPAVLDASIKMAFKLFEANQETRRANEKLRAVITSFPDLLFILDRDGYYLSYEKSPRFSYLVLPEDKIVGSHISAAHPPEEADLLVSLFRECISTGEVKGYNYSMIMKGVERFFDLRISRINDQSVLVVVRDVTEERQADMELRLLSQAVDHVSANIVIVDEEGRIVFVNTSFEKTTGFTQEEARGQIPRVLLRTEISDEDYNEMMGGISSGKTWRRILINRKKTGEIFYEAAIISPVRKENGKISHFISIKENITELREIEAALLRSQNLLNEMGNIAKIGGWRMDLETLKVEWTDEVYSIYEIDKSFQPNLDTVLSFHLPESRRTAQAAIDLSMETGKPFDVEVEIITAKGNHRWIRMLGRPGYTGNRITHRVGVSQDISERKKSEELLRINEKKILDLLNEKEILLREVHHRIKNNMATMTSLLSLQAAGVKDPAAAAALRDAQNRFRSMAILYDKLYHTDNLQEMSIKSYLPSLIDDIIGMSPKSQFVKVQTDIEDFPLSIRELSTLGIIVNELITNAMKHAFIDKDQGELRISAVKDSRLVKLSVEDNGVGVSQEMGNDESGGFGLILVRSLVQQLKGNLEISRTGGTRISLNFMPKPPGEN